MATGPRRWRRRRAGRVSGPGTRRVTARPLLVRAVDLRDALHLGDLGEQRLHRLLHLGVGDPLLRLGTRWSPAAPSPSPNASVQRRSNPSVDSAPGRVEVLAVVAHRRTLATPLPMNRIAIQSPRTRRTNGRGTRCRGGCTSGGFLSRLRGGTPSQGGQQSQAHRDCVPPRSREKKPPDVHPPRHLVPRPFARLVLGLWIAILFIGNGVARVSR